MEKETFSNTTNPNRIYGKKRELEAARLFCKNKPFSFVKCNYDDDTQHKFDVYLICLKTKKIISNLSIKCSPKYINGSFPKKDLVPENMATEVLFEDMYHNSYLINYNLLKQFINNGYAIEHETYYVILQRDLKRLAVESSAIFENKF